MRHIITIQRFVRKQNFLKMLHKCHSLYLSHGSRSNKKVNHLHTFISLELQNIFNSNIYQVHLEKLVPSYNNSGFKKCDIVVSKYNHPYIVFPIKFVMTNYKQNKNNMWENITGEILHLKHLNPDLHIIPINIIYNKLPYLLKSGLIKNFEHITYQNSLVIYEKLKTWNLCHNTINYIIDVNHHSVIGDLYNTTPSILGFNYLTPFKPLSEILHHLI